MGLSYRVDRFIWLPSIDIFRYLLFVGDEAIVIRALLEDLDHLLLNVEIADIVLDQIDAPLP